MLGKSLLDKARTRRQLALVVIRRRRASAGTDRAVMPRRVTAQRRPVPCT